MGLGSRWATWLWRWSLLQAVLGVIALPAAFVPAARLDGAVGWVVLGAGLAVTFTGAVLAFGGFFGGLASMPTGRVSETEWNRLAPAERRGLARAVRRGRTIDPAQRELARWHAERSIRGGLPQACLQGAMGIMWLGNSLTDAVGDGLWWFHAGLGTLQLAFAIGVLWVLGRVRASLTRLEGEQTTPVG